MKSNTEIEIETVRVCKLPGNILKTKCKKNKPKIYEKEKPTKQKQKKNKQKLSNRINITVFSGF